MDGYTRLKLAMFGCHSATTGHGRLCSAKIGYVRLSPLQLAMADYETTTRFITRPILTPNLTSWDISYINMLDQEMFKTWYLLTWKLLCLFTPCLSCFHIHQYGHSVAHPVNQLVSPTSSMEGSWDTQMMVHARYLAQARQMHQTSLRSLRLRLLLEHHPL